MAELEPPAKNQPDAREQRRRRQAAIADNARAVRDQARERRSSELLAPYSSPKEAFAALAAAGAAATDQPVSDPETAAPQNAAGKLPDLDPLDRPDPPARARPALEPLTKNPRKLAFYRMQCVRAVNALDRANREARRDALERLSVPREIYQLCHDICDSSDALAGAVDWVRRRHGPAVAIELESAALYRERGGFQHDDWSCPRARRKAALLVFLLMAPHALPRSSVTGSPSNETLLVTAGVPQTLLVLLLRSGQREPYVVRTLQRDLAEIDLCTELLLRWRTPIAHAQSWERGNSAHGVVNRYCVRAGMIGEQWRRARDSAEAFIKGTAIRLASWLVWRPAPARGSAVPWDRGGWLEPAARPVPT